MSLVHLLTDDVIEPLAAAIAWGEFTVERKDTPTEYWERVAPGPKAIYRNAARRLLEGVFAGGRLMPHGADRDILGHYMHQVPLASINKALKHYGAMYSALPTIWQDYAKTMTSDDADFLARAER